MFAGSGNSDHEIPDILRPSPGGRLLTPDVDYPPYHRRTDRFGSGAVPRHWEEAVTQAKRRVDVSNQIYIGHSTGQPSTAAKAEYRTLM